MQFSERTRWDTGESELAAALREKLARGEEVVDLTASNPTRCGFSYQGILEGLTDEGSLDYDPNPLGTVRARQAVCGYYADHGVQVELERVLLTTSTSEAYGFLFKLLCDPGDEVLVPQPGYPLFDFLAGLEGVQLGFTPLVYEGGAASDGGAGWRLDLGRLRERLTDRTRAIVLVHPNNPTGHFTGTSEATELAEICRERGIALIVDEVFLDYPMPGSGKRQIEGSDDRPRRRSFLGRDLETQVFVVSGISKICGLPQMKVAWVVTSGPGAEQAMSRLEVVADTYLSMNAVIQNALPGWLAGRGLIQDQIRRRVGENLQELDAVLAGQKAGMVTRLEVQAGWYAVLRIPAWRPDEETVRRLLDRGIWVHPGYFFGMAERGWVVVSLLGPVLEFGRGMRVLIEETSSEP